MSATRQITLTEHPDGNWTAYDTTTERVSKGTTRAEALDNLGGDNGDEGEWNPVNPDDPIFTPTTFSSGTTDTSERIDEVLYGAGNKDE